MATLKAPDNVKFLQIVIFKHSVLSKIVKNSLLNNNFFKRRSIVERKQDNEQILTQGDGDNEISEQEELEWLVQLDLIFNLWHSF